MKEDIYSQITARLIEQLEKGVVPWQSPFFSAVGLPKNFATGKEYQGINVLLLGSHRYTSPWFLTFLQAKHRGGFVKRGEKGSLVVKYGTYTKEEGEEAKNEEVKQCGYLKGYTVFHASQIEGIEFPQPPHLEPVPQSAVCDRARQIIREMPNAPQIRTGIALPCYRPSTDIVEMPEMAYFTSEEAYYATLFHELGHATGHGSRLARKSLLNNKGIMAGGTARKTYAEEELVAEITAAFLSAHAGIDQAGLENSAAYLQSWIEALKTKDAKGWIVRAAAQSQKAANFILSVET